jgi:hypothetical protein
MLRSLSFASGDHRLTECPALTRNSIAATVRFPLPVSCVGGFAEINRNDSDMLYSRVIWGKKSEMEILTVEKV